MVEKIGKADAIHLQVFVDESERRGEQLVVFMRNLKTGDELEIPINPHFLAGIFKYV